MQPYIFPYLGYFQLAAAVDIFIFYNDVNFIKKGWINRNRILLNGAEFQFAVPCKNVSQNRKICETEIAWGEGDKNKLLKTINQAYKSAPFFRDCYPVIENVLMKDHRYIDQLAIDSIQKTYEYLGLPKKFKESAGAYGNEELKSGDRLIDICRREDVRNYVNAQGGKELYSKKYFQDGNIQLQFLKPTLSSYPQFGGEFISGLSIIDILMFNSKSEIEKMLGLYSLE